ncbi:DUF6153 family protein [Streptomyces tropicalis]|uniref:DUF6153 family protein n=1 Tax=Streptomyces tropicalis TaxID=3034234 RepID=A0ABT6A8A8_9ACTN|nr:DUF6153 family protein [Streptomyces tropicalis]MDF3300880.1 DUF6153 family protein [Streptomyces tropicalis]
MTVSAHPGFAVDRARWLLLVMAVVAGVLGMHAMSPSGAPSAGQHVMMTALDGTRHHAGSAHADDSSCRHLSDAGQGGMVMDHAGGTCAAAGTAASYVPPALLPSLVSAPGEPAVEVSGPWAARTTDGRAPPDLSELQLLRI